MTRDVGPRILRYGFIGGQNLFKEFPEQLGRNGEADFQARGGHRLWKAPEDLATTWIADNHAVEINTHSDGLTAIAPVEVASGLQKEITIRLAPSESHVALTHRIVNRSTKNQTFAPWTLTVMAQGGLAVAGLPARAEYPENLQPTNPIVLWAYTDLSDIRWRLLRKYISLRQDPSRPDPQKIGLFNEHAWACYLLNGEMFLKRADANLSATYPDFGCSLEMFTNNEFLEIEALGPMRTLRPGESLQHVERWTLHRDVHLPEITDAAIDRSVFPLIAAEEPC
ncbi:MAG: hypothetical protein ACRD3F_16705 [Acidobacteriaceae bacterium]